MMRTWPSRARLAVLAALLAAPCLTAAADNVQRVDSRGMDGDNYYWQVRCTDGKKSTVVLNDKTRRMCAYPQGKAQKCDHASKTWTIREAAAYACR